MAWETRINSTAPKLLQLPLMVWAARVSSEASEAAMARSSSARRSATSAMKRSISSRRNAGSSGLSSRRPSSIWGSIVVVELMVSGRPFKGGVLFNFVDRGETEEDLAHAVVTERAITDAAGGAGDLLGAAAI